MPRGLGWRAWRRGGLGHARRSRQRAERGAEPATQDEQLLAAGAQVTVYDPEAMENVRAMHGDRLAYAVGPMEALDGADCLAIVTEWGDFRHPDFVDMVRRMRSPTIFDGRNLYVPAEMRARGFEYHSIGREAVA